MEDEEREEEEALRIGVEEVGPEGVEEVGSGEEALMAVV